MSKELQPAEKIRKKRWFRRLRNKYRLIISDDESLEPKFTIRLSRMNVFVITASSAVLLIILTTYLIAFTPLREYIPGYTDMNLSKNLYDMYLRADSLERLLVANEHFITNLKLIISDESPLELNVRPSDTVIRRYDQITLTRSKEDSVLRKEFENQYRSGIFPIIQSSAREGINFFTPLKGIITNEYDPSQGHFGIDLVAPENEAVKATLDGVVIFASWTIETGYVIALQHQRNFISIYKHNAVLLKKIGAFVRAGDPIAIVGESGRLTTGPHLHFELWYNGNAVNPRDYMAF
ncbi:MAG: M23 family metallopeptidase [Bacteroidales bacterium]|nr:M23 family metallopeptidase [Bacteroidales bacterium]MDZ4203512.1 M23 family metallopeptidase [Bacteroidales bacterium]